MIRVSFVYICLTAGFTFSSSLRIEELPVDCSQPGLRHCTINNCSDMVADRHRAPTGPDWAPQHVQIGLDRRGLVPVVNVTWLMKGDSSISALCGSQINVVEERTNQSLCLQFSFATTSNLNPDSKRWAFSVDEVVVEPGQKYTLTVFNLPEPHIGDYRIRSEITIPGCEDTRIQNAQMCLENGSLWEPGVSVAVFSDKKSRKLSVTVGFQMAKYSDRYWVYIHNSGAVHSRRVLKENRTSANVTFELALWQLSQCEIFITVKPYFVGCKSSCWRAETLVDYCLYLPHRTAIVKTAVVLCFSALCLGCLLWRTCYKDLLATSSSATKEQPATVQIQGRKRVLVVYSCDHPLYKRVVLRLCAFLASKCGTEVILDRLDSARLGVLGRIQWLECHRKRIESSSEKILFLCSPGVQAKWRAMCGDKPVFLREDVQSPVGDMLTPSLGLLLPQFIRCTTFEKYIVAFFDDVCSEDDVPSPFRITVRYKLMRQFEEVFFRILDTEKHEPGRVKQIQGLSENKFSECPSGRALQNAIEAFRAYQLQHPRWFEEELLEGLDLDVENSTGGCERGIAAEPSTCCVQNSVQVV